MKTGAELIAEERNRQQEAEGYGPDHDDGHDGGQLAGAGACYALWHAGYVGSFCWRLVMSLWPWEHEEWKPKDQVKDLVRAGALIAAEIDRVQRVAARRDGPRIITKR